VQRQRLAELGAGQAIFDQEFPDVGHRNRTFQEVERGLVEEARRRLESLRQVRRRPVLCQLEEDLVKALIDRGFTQVVTPILLPRVSLEKMTITEDHPLFSQVFWVDPSRCLRPMLAPNLYKMMVSLARVWPMPIRIFEVGPCFRKETSGAQHLNEFTMLNLVEMGLPQEERAPRLRELASLVMVASGISDYQLHKKESEVYGTTLDVVSGLELGSGAMGPHPLDEAWGVFDTWVGIGFGLERLAMVREGYQGVHRVGRSLAYLDGVRLNIG
jgi:phenylalanyl-tRNA synthetase alpha chain